MDKVVLPSTVVSASEIRIFSLEALSRLKRESPTIVMDS